MSTVRPRPRHREHTPVHPRIKYFWIKLTSNIYANNFHLLTMGSETLAIQRHRTEQKFTPHFIVDILRSDSSSSSTRRRDSDHSLSDRGLGSSSSVPCPSMSVSSLSPLSPFSMESDRERQRSKKMRTTFTGRQIFVMEKMFETKKYLNATERSHLSR